MKAFKPWPDRIVRQNTCMNTRACAVLVPIIYKDGEEQAVFEVRSSKLGCSLATSASPAAASTTATTALWKRPCGRPKEELGVDPVPYPRLGPWIHGIACRRHGMALCRYMDTDDFVLSRGEVDHTFTVPLSWFDEHEPEIGRVELATRPAPGFPKGLDISHQTGWKQRRTYNVKIYTYENYKIWGITAHILDNFRGIRAIIQQ